MANPNIFSNTSVYGKTTVTYLTTTANTLIIENPAASSKIIKLVSLRFIPNGAATGVTVNYYDQDNLGGSAFALMTNVSASTGYDILFDGSPTPLYLPEDSSIGAQADTGNILYFTCVYYEIT